jgi:hypothetical protein
MHEVVQSKGEFIRRSIYYGVLPTTERHHPPMLLHREAAVSDARQTRQTPSSQLTRTAAVGSPQ